MFRCHWLSLKFAHYKLIFMNNYLKHSHTKGSSKSLNINEKIRSRKFIKTFTLPIYPDASSICMQSKVHVASNLSLTKFCRVFICARYTLSSCVFVGVLLERFFRSFERSFSVFSTFELATASRMYRALSRILDAPIGFAQRISQPCFSTMLSDSKK